MLNQQQKIESGRKEMPKKEGAKKEALKAAAAKGARPRNKKGTTYECRVCGYRIIVDEACGCAEEHVFVCCNEPMKKKRATAK
jgi:rubrerythrin